MKRFLALIMAVVMAVSFVSCGQQTENKTEEYTRPDLTYWQENAENVQAEMSIGNTANGDVSPQQVLRLMEGVEYGEEVSVRPQAANYYASHSAGLVNEAESKSICLIFYADFSFAALSENGVNGDTTPVYRVMNSELCKKFFVDNGYYMPLDTRTEIVDKITAIILAGTVEQINRKVEPSGKDGSIVNIIPGQLERLKITNVAPISYGYGDYMVSAEIGYDYGQDQRIYHATIFMDREYNVASAYITEEVFQGQIANPYMIGDVDYSLWMEKLDNAYFNHFMYQLCSYSFGHGSSSMQWNASIMDCIQGLQLGEEVEFNQKDYKSQQVYSIILSEESQYYDENMIVFGFYDDCNYLVVCDCQGNEVISWTVCPEHNKAYKVENPETVRQLFSMEGQYIPPEDYESLEKFTSDFIRKTDTPKLNEMAVSDVKIDENYTLRGDITQLTARIKKNGTGEEKHYIEFVVMYAGQLPNGNKHYLTYKIEMVLAKNGKNWQIETLGIRNY